MIKSALSVLKVFIIIAYIVIVSALIGCSRSTKLNALHITFYRDPVTGVNYVVYDSEHGAGIWPRLNADGTLFVEEKDAE